ncbi:tRNA uridine-5-carboxymethylaminomethyl(34) synthesis GTPase MnmE, partial [Candidatus Babeliales bacterium]|nr:tRNA uridine-5-carboxymethylaminomethyl(34) synthesis GTPase MnmE [Candidatus Babeliales bacterium]
IIIDQIIKCAIHAGARHSEGGEFTQRALLNNKLNLTQAEAVHDVITAQTQAALQRCMAQLTGTLSHHLETIETSLVHLICLMEASFEFLEEEQRDTSFSQTVTKNIEHLLELLNPLESSAKDTSVLRRGIRIALAGPTNAGKSTLFNRLLQKDRAIVNQAAGTTRDSIEAETAAYGQLWSLVDTAGLHNSDDVIEQEGIIRSKKEIEHADIVVFVIDNTKTTKQTTVETIKRLVQKHKEKLIVAFNKIDQDHQNNTQQLTPKNIKTIKISAQTGRGIADLVEVIKNKIKHLFDHAKSPFLLNQRQRSIICELSKIVKDVHTKAEQETEYEILVCHLKDSLKSIYGLMGKELERNVIDKIFKTFCVGK